MAATTKLCLPNSRRRWWPWPSWRLHRRTERREARARTIEAGLTERRRLERDLHDGAQQRLVSLALTLRTVEAGSTTTPPARGGCWR
jgi:signal transduction histidine kinase